MFNHYSIFARKNKAFFAVLPKFNGFLSGAVRRNALKCASEAIYPVFDRKSRVVKRGLKGDFLFYLPTQKRENMLSSTSSVALAPVMPPRRRSARRRSTSTQSGGAEPRESRPSDSAESRQRAIEREWDALCMLEMQVEHMTGKEAIELVRARKG